MAVYCFVEGCNSTQYKCKNRESKPHVSFYGFPTNPELRKKWVHTLLVFNQQKSVLNLPRSARICILHFSNDCIEQFGLSHARLKPNSVPSKFPKASVIRLTDLTSTTVSTSMIEPVKRVKTTQEAKIAGHAALARLEAKGYNVAKFKTLYAALEANVKRKLEQEEKAKQKAQMNSLQGLKEMQTDSHEDMQRFQRVQSGNLLLVPEVAIQPALENDKPKRDVENVFKVSVIPKKKLRYPGDVQSAQLENMSRETIANVFNILKRTCQKKNQQIKLLQTQQRRQRKKIQVLEHLLLALKKQALLSSNSASMMQAISKESSIIQEIKKGKVNGKYSSELRAFALTTNLYSPKAYQYIRRMFKNMLPAPSTVRSWSGTTDGF